MAAASYRFVIQQDETPAYRSTDILDGPAAYEMLSLSAVGHAAFGWEVMTCATGFHAFKDGVHRSEHLERVDAEDAAPAPLDRGLVLA